MLFRLQVPKSVILVHKSAVKDVVMKIRIGKLNTPYFFMMARRMK